MTVLDYILCGFEEELALERELGVRTFECDRALLAAESAAATAPTPERKAPPPPPTTPAERLPDPPPEKPSSPSLPIAFLHDRALSEGGVGMMAKIIQALGYTADTAPIVFTGARPAAKVTVVLGGNALRKWFPGTNAAPGQWLAPSDGRGEVLVTYSPEYILRFGAVTPAVMEIKRKMWNSLKSAKQRAAAL